MMTRTETIIGATVSAAFVFVCLFATSTARAATKDIIWKPIDRAILEVTGRKPPKTWGVLQDAKKKARVLVQLDDRYLVLDAKTKQVFEISASQLQPHGKDFQSADPSTSERPVPSTDWDMRDLGPAERIEVRLMTDNTMLDVQLPHPLDLRVPLH